MKKIIGQWNFKSFSSCYNCLLNFLIDCNWREKRTAHISESIQRRLVNLILFYRQPLTHVHRVNFSIQLFDFRKLYL